MMSKKSLLEWVRNLPDGSQVGIDDGGLVLTTPDGSDWLEIGGIPEEAEAE